MREIFNQKCMLGLGLAALGRPGYINLGHKIDLQGGIDVQSMEEQAHRVLDQAWKLGFRYFDTARSYGLAEKFLSTWLSSRGISSVEVKVGSKWGYIYTADWKVQAKKHEIKEHTLEVLKRQSIESNELLGDYLNLYHIHSATLESGVLDNKEVLDELSRMKGNGLLIGLSLSGANQAEVLRKAIDLKIDGVSLFDGVQATFNVLENSVEDALEEAKAAGLGVIIKEALANGRLTDRNLDRSFLETHKILETLTRKKNCTLDALALAYVLHKPFVDIVLSGASTKDHILSNYKAISVSLDEFEMRELKTLAHKAEVYWGARSSLVWN